MNNRFDTSIELVYNQEQQHTSILKQRHIESRAKKQKKTDNKSKDSDRILATMGVSCFAAQIMRHRMNDYYMK